MSAEDILEQIGGILDDDSISTPDKVYMVRDITHSEIAEDEITRKIGLALWEAGMVVSTTLAGFVITTEDGKAFQLTIELSEDMSA